MTKDEKGLWSVTTPKPLAPDTYRYFFYVNGVRSPIPRRASTRWNARTSTRWSR